MCLYANNYPTNSKYVNVHQIGVHLTQTYNCGKCAQCRKSKALDYHLRSSAEYKSTLKKNGFAYWDTLTYDNDHLPVIVPVTKYVFNNDTLQWLPTFHYEVKRGEHRMKDDGTTMRTFCRDDFRLFIKNLRQLLKRRGFESKGNLRYFFTSEYGDPLQHTFRPHYHPVFFVTIPYMTPLRFQFFVRRAWPHGRCDLDTPLYPIKDPKTGKMRGRVLTDISVTNYVSKYVNKPFKYTKLLEKFRDDNNLTKEEYNIIRPYHRESKGFGLSLADNFYNPDTDEFYNNHDLMLTKGKVHFFDFGEHRTYPMPAYLKRKLFYDCVTFADGTRHWQLNELGYLYKRNTETSALLKQTQRLEDACKNISQLNIWQYHQILEISKEKGYKFAFIRDDHSSLIRDLLDNRSMLDLAIYVRYYRGRVKNIHNFKPTINQILDYDTSVIAKDYSDPTSHWSLSECYPNSVYVFDDVNRKYKIFDYYDPITGFTWFGKTRKQKDFIAHYAINQNSYPCFRYFDDILRIIDSYNYFISKHDTIKYLKRENSGERVQLVRQVYNF